MDLDLLKNWAGSGKKNPYPVHVNLGSVFCIMIIFMFYVGVLSSLIVLSLIVVIIIITHRRAHSQVGQLSRLQHYSHIVYSTTLIQVFETYTVLQF